MKCVQFKFCGIWLISFVSKTINIDLSFYDTLVYQLKIPFLMNCPFRHYVIDPLVLIFKIRTILFNEIVLTRYIIERVDISYLGSRM